MIHELENIHQDFIDLTEIAYIAERIRNKPEYLTYIIKSISDGIALIDKTVCGMIGKMENDIKKSGCVGTQRPENKEKFNTFSL